MVRAAYLIPVLLLAGCDDLPRARSESEIREIARTVGRDDIAKLQMDITDLQTEIRRLKTENEIQDRWIDKAFKGAASLETQVNQNAAAANANAVKEMTRRGACGRKPVYTYNAQGEVMSITSQNIPCTLADLRD